jgi:NAD-dependent dihydropyrimidine dehydrogenase PreA subunit
LPTLAEVTDIPEVIKTVARDIPDLGTMGLQVIPDIGERKTMVFAGCVGDAECVLQCPENALKMKRHGDSYSITIDLALCNGMACRRCERACKDMAFDLAALLTCEPKEAAA